MATHFRFDRLFEESMETLEEDMDNLTRLLESLPRETDWTSDQEALLLGVRVAAQRLRDVAQKWLKTLEEG